MFKPKLALLDEDKRVEKAVGLICRDYPEHAAWARAQGPALLESPSGTRWSKMISCLPLLIGNKYEIEGHINETLACTLIFYFIEKKNGKEPSETAPSQASGSSSAPSSTVSSAAAS